MSVIRHSDTNPETFNLLLCPLNYKIHVHIVLCKYNPVKVFMYRRQTFLWHQISDCDLFGYLLN